MNNSVWGKSLVIVIIFILIFPVVSNARIAVNWIWDANQLQPVVLNDGVTLLPTNSTIQLIWSADTTLGALDVNDPLAPTGGDVLLDTKGNESEGWWNFGVNTYDGGGAYVGGYIFQRVFSAPLGSVPGHYTEFGDGLYTGGPLADADGSPTPPADLSYLWVSSGSPYLLYTLIIPEPGSAILIFVGLGIVASRRWFHS